MLDPHRVWMDNAACTTHDLTTFFPTTAVGRDAAKRICATCPVNAACLQHALDHDEEFGIWGGLDPDERYELANGHRRPRPSESRRKYRTSPPAPAVEKPIVHGTDRGYAAHRRANEPACDACTAAHAAYQRRRQLDRRHLELVPTP